MKRNLLIALALKYDGEYFKIRKAIENGEKVMPLFRDDCITIFDDNYPDAFKNLAYPPYVIFYRGNLELLEKEAIAVVGSRDCSKYSILATNGLIKKHQDKVIVSGLAKGIDYYAHLNAKNRIGILGCGIDYYYP